jgi:predicted ATPase
MLETIREYATERLEERGEEDELRRRHADHFLSRAEEAAVGAPSELPEAGVWLRDELDNIRRARGRLIALGDV